MSDQQGKGDWDGLRLFADLPKDAKTLAEQRTFADDPLRLEPVVKILYSHIRAALLASVDSDRRQLRLGLFGGLGQGKTSAVQQVIEKLRQEVLIPQRMRPWQNRSLREEFFDAADYKPDQLEFEFDRLIAPWYLHRRLGLIAILGSVGIIPLFLVAGYFFATLPSASDLPIFLRAIFPLFLSLLVGLFLLLSRFIRQSSRGASFREHNTSWKSLVQQNFLPIFFPPDLVVIDNLDRASVSQQRAILRAVRKHSDLLSLPLIVVMDETELLRAKPYDAESPEELLRKVIQVECRMPIRVADDAALLVLARTAEGAQNNAGKLTGRLLSDAQLQGDWTRIFTLLGDIGPRRVKRFLNDLLSSCVEVGISEVNDIAAVSRLYALFSLVPELRRTSEEVIFALAANDESSLTALSSKVTPPDQAKHVVRFLRLTRHLQPKDANWRQLVVRLSGSKPQTVPNQTGIEALPRIEAATQSATAQDIDAGGQEKRTFSIAELERIGGHLRAVGKGFSGPFAHEETGENRLPFDAVQYWPVAEAVLGAAEAAVERRRILVRWQRTFADEDKALRILYRAWLADEEVLALMSVDERKQLFRHIEKLRIRELLLLVPGQYLHFVDRVTLAAKGEFFGLRDVHSIGPWLAAGERRPALLEEPPLLRIPGSEDVGLINLTWPPFTHEGTAMTEQSCHAELKWHLTALHVLYKQGIETRPNSLQTSLFERGWLQQQADHIPALLAVLHHLLLTPVGELPDHTVPPLAGRFHLLDVLLLDDRKGEGAQNEQSVLQAFLTALSRCNFRDLQDDQAWWTGLLIGLYYRDVSVCWLWREDIVKRKRQCKDLRLLEYLISDEMQFLWQKEVFTKDVLLTLFSSAFDAFADHRDESPKNPYTRGRNKDKRFADIAQALHRRARPRSDYSEMLSQLRRTPPVPPRASDVFATFPSEDYLRHLIAVSGTTDTHRRETARALVQRARSAETIEVRNRSLIDAVALLTTREIAPREWRFVDRGYLTIPSHQAPLQSDEIWTQLTEEIVAASEATPGNFEELIATFALLNPSEASDPEKCYDWGCFRLPYINVDLSTADADRDIMLSRLNQIANLCHDPFFSEEVRVLGRRRIRLWVSHK